MEFIYIDLTLLAIFSIFVTFFLIKNRKKLKVESKVLLLYKTKVGIKFINWASKTFSPIMPFFAWASILCGFFLIVSNFFLLILNLFLILKTSIQTFPLVPILPYVPQALDLGLPNFYFIHWILAIVLLATTHEAAHGIFASFYKIKIKSTGFGFLGPILTAFVEPDEKVIEKRSAKQQLSIFAAGSFSNLVFGIIFILVLQLFFLAAYTPVGVGGYRPIFSYLNLTEVDAIGEYSPQEFLSLSDEEILNIKEILIVRSEGKNYYINSIILSDIVKNKQTVQTKNIIPAFDDTPAFRANLSGGIQKINGNEVKNMGDIQEELSKYNPGEEITITTTEKNYKIILDKNPNDPSKSYVGIGFIGASPIQNIFTPFFNPYIYTEPNFNEQIIIFISDFFVWLVIIFIGVALFNMMPLGFLDGGRFVLIAAFALTKSKKKAMIIFKIFSSLVLFILLLMILFWAIK